MLAKLTVAVAQAGNLDQAEADAHVIANPLFKAYAFTDLVSAAQAGPDGAARLIAGAEAAAPAWAWPTERGDAEPDPHTQVT